MTSKVDLYLGDCLEILPTLLDKSVEAIITDLPYGTTACSWDVVIPFEPMWAQVWRILKTNGVFITTATEPFTSLLVTSSLREYRQSLIWQKTRPTNVFNAKIMFMNWHEDVCIFYRKPPTYNPQMRADGEFTGTKIQRLNTNRSNGVLGKTGERKDYIHESNGGLFYPKTILEFSNVNIPSEHPTQKPVALYEYLIRTYTNEGDTVLDFCAGSGTTGVAAVMLDRNIILIEKEKKYFEIMRKRIEIAQSQPLLEGIV